MVWVPDSHQAWWILGPDSRLLDCSELEEAEVGPLPVAGWWMAARVRCRDPLLGSGDAVAG